MEQALKYSKSNCRDQEQKRTRNSQWKMKSMDNKFPEFRGKTNWGVGEREDGEDGGMMSEICHREKELLQKWLRSNTKSRPNQEREKVVLPIHANKAFHHLPPPRSVWFCTCYKEQKHHGPVYPLQGLAACTATLHEPHHEPKWNVFFYHRFSDLVK